MGSQNNVFISHYGKDDDNVQDLKKRLKDKGYDIRNSSIDSTKHENKKSSNSDQTIEKMLKEKIAWSGTFICLIGKRTHTRSWVDYEIDQAVSMGKKIIGVYKHGCAVDTKLPKNLEKYADSIIGWNSTDDLGNAIASDKASFENPDGTKSEPIHKIERVSC